MHRERIKRFNVFIDSQDDPQDDLAYAFQLVFSTASLQHATLAGCLSAKNYNVTLRLARVETSPATFGPRTEVSCFVTPEYSVLSDIFPRQNVPAKRVANARA